MIVMGIRYLDFLNIGYVMIEYLMYGSERFINIRNF